MSLDKLFSRCIAPLALICFFPIWAYCEPPNIPKEFDKQQVETMLSQVEASRNASYLKNLYFSSRRKQALPVAEGWELLKAACSQAKPLEKRWFILQNIKAYSSFRIASVPRDDGFDAYEAIFENAKVAHDAGADYYLRQAVTEYVNSTPTTFVEIGCAYNPKAGGTLAKAWDAFVVSESSPSKFPYLHPQWSKAFDVSGVTKELPGEVLAAVDKDSYPKTFDVLSNSAYIVAFKNQDKAMQLYKEALKLDPLNENGGKDAQALSDVYGELIGLLRSAGKDDEALQQATEQVTRLDVGRKFLIQLAKPEQHPDFYDNLLAGINLEKTDEAEIADVTEALYGQAYDAEREQIWNVELLKKTAAFIEKYLMANRVRPVRSEATLRLRLASVYLLLKNKPKALQALNANLTSDGTADTNRLLQQIKAQQATLTATK